MRVRVGQGIDVHPFDERRPLTLGGFPVAESGGLAGHSDADAVLHAITDALLGAVSAGDIGEYFPSSDERWRGAASSIFVREALRVVREKGGVVSNIDVTIVAQKPKLAMHRLSIRESVASITGLALDDVSIKATTTDHLGFVGRGEGICAIATVLVSFES